MLHPRSILSLGLSVFAIACGGSAPIPENAAEPAPSSIPPAPVELAKSPEPEKAPEPAKPAPPTPLFRITEGVSTPESVLYDEVGDRYLVSNIQGKPDDVDNNGYIMELSPDGKVTREKFIAGGVGKVKLSAPKGSGIYAGTLWVADINVVRQFDVKTGAPKGDIAVPGATFLNDLAIAKDGRVFVSDSGLKTGPGGFEPTGTDAVYVIEKGKLKTIAKGKELAGPNGLLLTDKGLLVGPFGGDTLYFLDDKGAKRDSSKLATGGFDGIAVAGDSLLVTSWAGAAIYKGTLDGKFELAFSDLKGPADIGFDSKRKRVLVPRFLDNAVEVYELK